MRRAYRRPIAKAEVDEPMAFYRKGRAEGDFDAGITTALSAVLTNPEFLFRVESDPKKVAANGVYRISDLDLASRLSFFHVPRTSRPSWKIIASPVPVRFVSGTGLPAGSR